MFTAGLFRVKAAEYAESLKRTDVPSEIRELHRSKQRFSTLAQNEDWLAGNFDSMLHSQDLASEDKAVGRRRHHPDVEATEEHVLRCLGAAVIMQWNTIPKKLQRELFDTAGSLGDLLQTAKLRGQIARFLHKHKDEESPVDRIAKPQHEGDLDGS
jgi:hypothetical protein